MRTARRTFTSIQQIRDHQFAGNHFHDFAAFDAIYAFVTCATNESAHRAEACRIMADKGMSMPYDSHLSDDEVIALFLAEES